MPDDGCHRRQDMHQIGIGQQPARRPDGQASLLANPRWPWRSRPKTRRPAWRWSRRCGRFQSGEHLCRFSDAHRSDQKVLNPADTIAQLRRMPITICINLFPPITLRLALQKHTDSQLVALTGQACDSSSWMLYGLTSVPPGWHKPAHVPRTRSWPHQIRYTASG